MTAVITIELFPDIFQEKALSTITTDFTAFISDSKAVHARNIEREWEVKWQLTFIFEKSRIVCFSTLYVY